MNINYRNASVYDFKDVVEIFLSSMDLSVFTKATNENVLRNMATISLAKDFHTANYIKIAESDKKVCGVLIGLVNRDLEPALAFNKDSIIKNAKENLSKSDEGKMVLSEMKSDHEETNDKSKGTEISDVDSELVYFSVDEKYRRYNIGSTLIKGFEAYLKECGTNKYLLHTDNKCTYQYYDNNGYKRIEEKQSTFNPSVIQYIYVKELNNI